MSGLSIANYISQLIDGLGVRNINHVVSQDALGCHVTEVYVTEAQALILFPENQLDTESIQWILQVRTPLSVRITIFSQDASKLKIDLLKAINRLKLNGLEIPLTEQTISVQELTEYNIKRLLDSFENLTNSTTSGRPLPQIQSPIISKPQKENIESESEKQKDLQIQFRNAIKTYWTQRYFARYMNIPSQKVESLANQIGIQHEICGHEILYFFDRKKALGTYFEHIIRGILDALKLKYQETSSRDFFLPELHLTLHFIDREKEQLKIQVGEYTKNRNLMVIVPESLHGNIGRIHDDFFQVLPLNQDKIKTALIRVIRQRIDYKPAYSSGIIS